MFSKLKLPLFDLKIIFFSGRPLLTSSATMQRGHLLCSQELRYLLSLLVSCLSLDHILTPFFLLLYFVGLLHITQTVSKVVCHKFLMFLSPFILVLRFLCLKEFTCLCSFCWILQALDRMGYVDEVVNDPEYAHLSFYSQFSLMHVESIFI